ncbi:type I-E CRISPR-associated protein Cas5/CasD [Dermacoccus sp. Tok2021]|uniref:type I-E CRISPR-associated protein Cas5/CasD n=1 Tax=Dermacoccus sp. Tok2021 TaxID=2826873 RepID=UPI001CA740D6|nr:type I-E CRISPR-associated protein Cas5/CasD [Dermacoccus sp. Tok2021]MBZ4497951.1 hypothetical protein [Dermacoccus sp. Tok2021]
MSDHAVMLLRLAGAPTQAWNTARHAHTPGSSRGRALPALNDVTPRKSNLVGLLGTALGRRREEAPAIGRRAHGDVADLEALRYVVRVDLEGRLRTDFATSRARTTTGRLVTRPMSEVVVDDPAYLVGVSGDRDLVEAAWEALARPVFPLAYGRREYPIVLPVRVHLDTSAGVDVVQVVRSWPWLAPAWARRRLPRAVSLRVYETQHARVQRAGLPAYASGAGNVEHPPCEFTNLEGNVDADPIDWMLGLDCYDIERN